MSLSKLLKGVAKKIDAHLDKAVATGTATKSQVSYLRNLGSDMGFYGHMNVASMSRTRLKGQLK